MSDFIITPPALLPLLFLLIVYDCAMTTPPLPKKTSLANDDVAGATVSSGTGSSGGLSNNFTPELMARVATFASTLDSELMNICLAVGPSTSRIIKHENLKNNAEYLVRTLEVFLDNATKVAEDRAAPGSGRGRSGRGGGGLSVLERLPGSSTSPGPRPPAAGGANPARGRRRRRRGNCVTRIDKCSLKAGENYKAWMSVNSDWKSNVKKCHMKSLKLATRRRKNDNSSVRLEHACHPFIAFNNPAVAIQFGLMDVLKYLVEEKGIDINARKWMAFTFNSDRLIKDSLLAYTMGRGDCSKQIEMYKYLLGRDDVDFVGDAKYPKLSNFRNAIVSKDLLRPLINHPRFDANVPFENGSSLPLVRVIGASDLMAFRLLLEAGADPNLVCPKKGLSTLEFAKKRALEFAKEPAWKDLVEHWDRAILVMEEAVRMRRLAGQR